MYATLQAIFDSTSIFIDQIVQEVAALDDLVLIMVRREQRDLLRRIGNYTKSIEIYTLGIFLYFHFILKLIILAVARRRMATLRAGLVTIILYYFKKNITCCF